MLSEVAADWIGRVIDNRYRIVELLGEGGMGAVFVAEHRTLRKQVALKIIRAEFSKSAVAERRFAREATATATLDHPNVASAIDFGTLPEGGAFLVMQLARGVSLARQLERGKLRWTVACDVAAQVADALAAAHAAGIVHRDLKPDNILVAPREDGQFSVKVVDFGIARLTEEALGNGTIKPLTRMGAILGTPGYMAPEQAVGEVVDNRGDLYALGVILWECCTGRRLWTGESVAELVACQIGSTPPTLQQEFGSQVPAALSELVARLLAVAPGQRPAAAGPVRDALRRLALGQELTSSASLPGQPFGSSTAALPMAIVPASAHGWSTAAGGAIRKRRWVSVVAALVIAAAAIGAGLFALSGDGEEAVVAAPPVVAAAPVQAVPVIVPVVVPDLPPPSVPDLPPAVDPEPVVDAAADAGEEPPEAPLPASVVPEVPVVTPKGALELPAALVDDLQVLAGGESRKARKRAAGVVIAYKPKAAVPVFALNAAWLEKAASCPNKRAVIEKMQADGDPRALPALRRLARVPRRGCGWFDASDCLGCLRGTLGHAVAFLEGRAAAGK